MEAEDRLSQLPSHLLDYLLDHITKSLDLDDLLRFSCVCKYFRSFSSSLLPPPHLPWLIVPYNGYFSRKGTIFNQTLGFMSFKNPKKIYKVKLPEIANRRICGSCKGGWLITIHENGEIQLLHPFKKSVIELPPVTELPNVCTTVADNKLVYFVPNRTMGMNAIASSDMREFYVYKGVMSSTCPANGIVMVIHGVERKLAFCRPRSDKEWRVLRGDNRDFEDIVISKGDFYAVQDGGHVFVICGLDGSSPFVKLVIADPCKRIYLKKHLVESHGELFLLTRVRYPTEPGDEKAHLTMAMMITKIDVSEPKWMDHKNIDKDCAMFVGCNESFTLLTSRVPACKGNSIYFTDDCLEPFMADRLENFVEESYGGHDIGIYNNADGVLDRFYPSTSSLLVKPPPVWFSTSLY
ncbi:hypothetical protein ACHQM5_029273 [Ranunculus cassubicifolius]